MKRRSRPVAMALVAMLAAAAAAGHPRLFFGPDDVPELRRRAATPEGERIVARLDAALAREPTALDIGYHAAGHALRWILTGDDAHAAQARALVEDTLADRIRFVHPRDGAVGLWHDDYRLIFRVKPALGVALAYDLAHDAWPPEFRTRVAAALERQAAVLVDTTRGVNTQLWSNWQFSTKAAGGIVALAVAGHAGTSSAASDTAERARTGVLAHLAELGERGWTVEGFNYLRYPASHGGYAFFTAWQRARGEDLTAATPARWFMPLYAMHLVPPRGHEVGYTEPFLPFFGLAYVESATGRSYPLWERSVWRGGDFVAGLGLVPERDDALRAALRWTFDRCFGFEGDGSFNVVNAHDALFALLHYPFEVAAANPAAVLPRAWVDKTLGYFVWRGEWRDSQDRIAALTANLRPRPRSYSFQDAGSFRLAGLGGYWAVQRPADRGGTIDRAKENVVTIPGTHQWHGGRVVHHRWDEARSRAVVTLDLDAVYLAAPPPESERERRFEYREDLGLRARRSVALDLGGTTGSPLVLAVADLITGPGERTWRWHTLEQFERTENGFRLVAANGATLEATVLEPAAPWDLRFAAGEIQLRGEGSFIIVATVQPANTPHPAVKLLTQNGGEWNLQVGPERWRLQDADGWCD
jgi:hypothetical protein